MSKNKYLFLISVFSSLLFVGCNKENIIDKKTEPTSTTLTLFNEILFYDGYAKTVDKPVPYGKIRVSNSKYVTQIPENQLDSVSDYLSMRIVVKAACDNYDRVGNVFLNFMDKGKFYDKNELAASIEIARFITPFMDKNKQPNEVTYDFQIDNIAKLLTDPSLKGKYDFWVEFDIFGVPYAANKQIEGCSGRNDTFYGTLKFISTNEAIIPVEQNLIPVAQGFGLNNYSHTDEPGKTIKTYSISIEEPLPNVQMYIITSNHGANKGGEEYNRREHYIYFDDNLIDSYIPGGKSCEPFRKVNSQVNGIYGSTPRSDEIWASFSNWCPGDVIPIRIFELGYLAPGAHTFRIEVPDAEFVDKQGNIPLSVYLQSDK